MNRSIRLAVFLAFLVAVPSTAAAKKRMKKAPPPAPSHWPPPALRF